MPVLDFVDRDDDILRKRQEAKSRLTKADRRGIKDLIKTIEANPKAIAIAAPQVGVPLRAFVVRGEHGIQVVVNPRILWTSDEDQEEIILGSDDSPMMKRWAKWEGCMSLPGREFLIVRPYIIKVEFETEKGASKRMTYDNWTARIFCHEMDHLDGVLACDVANEERDLSEGEGSANLI